MHVVCSRQRYDDPDARLRSRDWVAGVAVSRVWTSRFGRDHLLGRAVDYATFYVSSGFALLRLLKRGDTIVAKTDPPLISIVAMGAAKVKGAQLINWLQDIFPEVASLLGANPLPRPLDSLLRYVRDQSLRAARNNVVLGERMRERLLLLGVDLRKIHIIENWAQRNLEAPKPAHLSTLRSSLDLGGRFVVCYSGNLGRAHEFQTLLGAAEILKNDAAIAFLMIGGGIGMTQLSCAVAERGLPNFRFLPYLPRESLRDGLAAANVHWVSLNPSLEGYIVPSKFYGILAAARPVVFIGDPDGELSRVIRTAHCGASVAVGDVGGLVRVLGDLKADPERVEREGLNGYRRYCERYSAQRAIEEWKRIVRVER